MRNIKSVLVRFFAVVGVIPVALTLVQRGVLTIEQAAGVVLAVVIAVAVVNSVMRLILPVFGIALFITYSATTNAEIKQITGWLILLVIMLLFGLSVMFGGVFSRVRRNGRACSGATVEKGVAQRALNARNIKSALLRFFAVVGVIPVALTLVQRGVLTIEQAAGVVLAVVIAVAVANSVMRLILPVFGIALFITYSATTNAEIKQITGWLILLVIMLFGLFVMFRGVFAGVRRK